MTAHTRVAEVDIEDSSLNRNRIIIAVGAVIVLVAVGVLVLSETEPPAPTSAEVELPTEPAGETAQPAQPSQPAQPKAAPRKEEPAAPAVAPEPVPPSFDVVRVERSGEAVIAGRAAPGSVITLFAGTRTLGQVTADLRGQWVLVVDTPLSSGSHELSLESRDADGRVLLSENVVVVSVPHPQVAAAEPAQGQAQIAQAPDTSQASETNQASEPKVSAPKVVARQPAPSETAASEVPTETTQQPAVSQAAASAAPAASSAPVAAVEQPKPVEQVARTEPAASTRQATSEIEQPLAVLMPRSGQGPSRILQQPEFLSQGLGEGTLVLETVDYDARGKTTVGGRAEAGRRLIIYLDDKPVAHATAGADGRWTATLARSVSQGLHRLRVDQLGADGQVTARVETPFSRAALVATLPEETAVIVQPGNSLWRIARRIYGEGVRYSVIYRANQERIGDPDLIYPGQIFIVPPTN